jgi:hypothetical protein
MATFKGYRPMQTELAAVSDAIDELNAFASWTNVFGITAPSASSIADRLTVAAGWTALYAQSESWASYTKSQQGMAWKDALEVLEALKPAFQLALEASPGIANEFPSLTRMLGAQKVASSKAASTRKKNAAGKAAGDQATAVANAAAAATAAANANAAATANANAAKPAAPTVTITG